MCGSVRFQPEQICAVTDSVSKQRRSVRSIPTEQSLCPFVGLLLMAMQAVFGHEDCLHGDALRLPGLAMSWINGGNVPVAKVTGSKSSQELSLPEAKRPAISLLGAKVPENDSR